MIRDLLTPENHRDPYVWAAVFLAHGAICQVLVVTLMFIVSPLVAASSVSLAYLGSWEALQLRSAVRRGDGFKTPVADGAVDAVGVALGCFTVAFAAMWLLWLALAAASSLLIVAATGYCRRLI